MTKQNQNPAKSNVLVLPEQLQNNTEETLTLTLPESGYITNEQQQRYNRLKDAIDSIVSCAQIILTRQELSLPLQELEDRFDYECEKFISKYKDASRNDFIDLMIDIYEDHKKEMKQDILSEEYINKLVKINRFLEFLKLEKEYEVNSVSYKPIFNFDLTSKEVTALLFYVKEISNTKMSDYKFAKLIPMFCTDNKGNPINRPLKNWVEIKKVNRAVDYDIPLKIKDLYIKNFLTDEEGFVME